jgi:UDP-GlcNAc:undecaprenyl-phosphate/decaprenyl-phosphate GlcNAc-1-phosphate transferase
MHSAAACAAAALATYLLTPFAIRLAMRTAFFDKPAGYKSHGEPTPYLGGCAIILGVLVGIVAGGLPSRYALLVVCALVVWLMGTVDDKLNLPIALRVAVEAGVGVALSADGLGWHIFHQGAADAALSVVWVVGVMNAFNLMDNMDGASATVAAVSSVGAGVLAAMSRDTWGLAPLCFATAGACGGFLPRNLANPAKIFMGDGGSLPLGLLVAGEAMTVVTRNYLGPSGVVIAALLVGMVVLDTTLVTISRSRAGQPVLTGGRDHLTHRLVKRVGSPRRVALALALTQLCVCAVTIAVAQAGTGWVLLAGGVCLVFGAVLIRQLEISPLLRPDRAVTVTQAESDGPDGEGAQTAPGGSLAIQ